MKDVIIQPVSGLDTLPDSIRERKACPREPSPTPSSSSDSSCDSKEGDVYTGKHFDPDVVSCGSLGKEIQITTCDIENGRFHFLFVQVMSTRPTRLARILSMTRLNQ